MTELSQAARTLLESYLAAHPELILEQLEVSMPGTEDVADDLLALFLEGKKRAASSLLREYEITGEALPKPGKLWILLDAASVPRGILRTRNVETHRFADVPESVATAEGEGDGSLRFWREVHREFFAPFLKEWDVDRLDDATVVVEYFDPLFVS
jgi:uncharacterized protein YhfF